MWSYFQILPNPKYHPQMSELRICAIIRLWPWWMQIAKHTYLDFSWGQFQRNPWKNLKNCDLVFCPSRPDLETRKTDWKLSAPPKGVPTLYLKVDIFKKPCLLTRTKESTQNCVLYQLFERFTEIWKTGKKTCGSRKLPCRRKRRKIREKR